MFLNKKLKFQKVTTSLNPVLKHTQNFYNPYQCESEPLVAAVTIFNRKLKFCIGTHNSKTAPDIRRTF